MDLNDTAARAGNVAATVVGGETVLLNLAAGTYFGLNPVGGRIWEELAEGPRSLLAIRDMLTAEFEVSEDVATADVLALAEDLHKNRLIEITPA